MAALLDQGAGYRARLVAQARDGLLHPLAGGRRDIGAPVDHARHRLLRHARLQRHLLDCCVALSVTHGTHDPGLPPSFDPRLCDQAARAVA